MITRNLTSTLSRHLRNAQFSKLYTWGERSVNLGHTNELANPIALEVNDVDQVVMGEIFTTFKTTQGELYTFGNGEYGNLGDGGSGFTDEPKKVAFFENQNLKVQDFDNGAYHTVASTENGEVYTWGKVSSVNALLKGLVIGKELR